jgi:hypothetical protein
MSVFVIFKPQMFPSEFQRAKKPGGSLPFWQHDLLALISPLPQPFERSTSQWFVDSLYNLHQLPDTPFHPTLVLSRFWTSPYHAFKTLADLLPGARHVTSTALALSIIF